ncbi:MAG TPA: inositol monophosphatase [Draconibacterium sp.]|nr:inositol monophosphatase [Draconibacterium sp.]
MKKILKQAVTEAGMILMHQFSKTTAYTIKENQSSIVTQADIDSERKIIEIISKAFSSHNILSEECGFQNRNSHYTWVIDPLDGTSNFAAGIPWFGVIICVLKNFQPVISGCYLPVQNQFYFAEKGVGAFLNNKVMTVSQETALKNILASYSLDFTDEPGKTEREVQIIRRLVQHIRNLRSTNCLVDLCYTADGRFGACANQTTKIWDIAGPLLLIEEAGGIASDLHGNPIHFTFTENDYNRNFEIVASNKTLHPLLIKLFTN